MLSNRGKVGQGGPLVAQAELRRVRAGLDRIELIMTSLEPTASSPGHRSRPERYYLLLIDVYERGRRGVEAEAFLRLGRGHGYDARGLGGFFLGARAPLRRGTGRVHLTTEGHRLVTTFLTRPTP